MSSDIELTQVWMPMSLRSAAEKRASTRLLSLMNVSRSFAPVQGLRGSSLVASRPSVKSIETRFAPAAKQPRMSFSHSFLYAC